MTAKGAGALLDRDAQFVALAPRAELDPGFLLELGARGEFDESLGAFHSRELDLPARNPDVERERARCLEGLAPHRALRGRGLFAGRESIFTSACPKGSG